MIMDVFCFSISLGHLYLLRTRSNPATQIRRVPVALPNASAGMHGTPAEDGAGHGDYSKRHAAVAPGVENTASRFRFANSDRATAVPCPGRVSTWPTVGYVAAVA
jgi:hypothetical protein